MEGRTLGSYTIERELGRGGMGAVYTAVHTLLGRRAAVKVLLAELSRDQDLVGRFFNEARAATAIKHPSIVEIYDFGWSSDGAAYIVMELMEGEPLSARRARLGRLPVAAAITIARQIANALAAAHRAGIVHRDLKPDNVFLVSDVEVAGGERVKLLDFGIAKLAVEGAASRTSTGAILGTPLYMSPEQCEGARRVDHRTDLYALGCIIFEMLAGRPPFESEGVGGLIGMHLYVAPPTLRSLAPEAPAELDALVARLLAKSPDERPATADEVAAELARIGQARTDPAASSSTAAASTSGAPVTAGALAVAAVASQPPGPSLPSASSGPSAPQAPSWPPGPPGPHGPHASLHPPTTLSGSSSAGPAVGPTTSRRGRGALIGGAVVSLAGAAVVVAVVAGGGGAARAPADVALVAATIDAAAPAADAPAALPVTVDAAAELAPADAALASMASAALRREWKAVRAALDAVYDGTVDGDPRRGRADTIIAEVRPQAIADARALIDDDRRRGRCDAGRRRAEEAIVDWGDDALVLRKLASACSTARSGDERVSIDAGAPPGLPPLTDAVIARVTRQQLGRLRSCVPTGTVRPQLRLEIAPDGHVAGATVDDVEPEVRACMIRALRSLRFPASATGGSASFSLPVQAPPVVRPPPTTGPLDDPLAPGAPRAY